MKNIDLEKMKEKQLISKQESTDPQQHFLYRKQCQIFYGTNCFVCGFCGQKSLTARAAWICLTQNVLSLQTLPCVHGYSQGSFTFYCVLCGKTYANSQDAARCLLKELPHHALPKPIAKHLALFHQEDKTKRPPLFSRKRMTSILTTPAVSSPESFSPPSETQAPTATDPVEKEVVNVQETSETIDFSKEMANTGDPVDHEADLAQKSVEQKKPIHYRKPGQTPFVRVNSDYVCTACNAKFFTKIEVEAHFMEHPLMEE
jgi:hypothetical protein